MQKLIISLLLAYSAPNATPATLLAPAIIEISQEFNLDPLLVTQIVLQESKGDPDAYNPASHDHGLMQINQATAISLKLTPKCLYDWKCNLRAGASILHQFSKYSDFQPCFYNTGRIGSKRDGGKKCLAYHEKLSQYVLIKERKDNENNIRTRVKRYFR